MVKEIKVRGYTRKQALRNRLSSRGILMGVEPITLEEEKIIEQDLSSRFKKKYLVYLTVRGTKKGWKDSVGAVNRSQALKLAILKWGQRNSIDRIVPTNELWVEK
jgi:hypothetical protein